MTLEEFKKIHDKPPTAKVIAWLKSEERAWEWLYHKSVSATGRKLTPEDRKKQSDGLKAYHQTPEWEDHRKLWGKEANESRRKSCREVQSKRIQSTRTSIHSNWGFRIDLECSFMSSWEANVARYLRFMGIEYKVEPYSFHLDEELRSYRPDFYLPTYDTFLEVKGMESPTYKKKMAKFLELYPWVGIVVLGYHNYRMKLAKHFQNVVPNWEKTREDYLRLTEKRSDIIHRALGTYTKQGDSCIPVCLIDYVEKPRCIGEHLTDSKTESQDNTEATCESRESVETTRVAEGEKPSDDIVRSNEKSLELLRNAVTVPEKE
jgi:hypothetical protein